MGLGKGFVGHASDQARCWPLVAARYDVNMRISQLITDVQCGRCDSSLRQSVSENSAAVRVTESALAPPDQGDALFQPDAGQPQSTISFDAQLSLGGYADD